MGAFFIMCHFWPNIFCATYYVTLIKSQITNRLIINLEKNCYS